VFGSSQLFPQHFSNNSPRNDIFLLPSIFVNMCVFFYHVIKKRFHEDPLTLSHNFNLLSLPSSSCPKRMFVWLNSNGISTYKTPAFNLFFLSFPQIFLPSPSHTTLSRILIITINIHCVC
jgi:hypothetical protein